MSMRLTIPVSLCASLAMLLTFVSPSSAQVSRDTWNDIQQKIRQRQSEQAIAQVEALLATNEPTAADRARLLDFGAKAASAVRPPRYDQIIHWHQRIVDDQSLSAKARIDSIESIADLQILQLGGQDLHEMDLAPAHATLRLPLSWKDLSPRDRTTALVNIGKLFSREEEFAQAREHYMQALELATDKRTQDDIHELIVYSWAGEGDFEKARKVGLAHNVDLIDLYRKFGMSHEQHAACIAVLEDPAASETQRWNAFRRLPAWHVYTRDYAMIRQASDKYLPAFTKSNEDRPRQVLMAVLRRLPADEQPAFILWAGPQIIASPKCTDADYAQVSAAVIEALAIELQIKPLQTKAAALQTDERLPVVHRVWLSLVADALSSNSSRNVNKRLDEQTTLTPEQKSEALLMAGRTLLRSGHQELARDLYKAHLALLKVLEPASLDCAFVPQAPADITQWLAWIKAQKAMASAMLNRPYGNNLQFLVETDSASTGRTLSQQTSEVSNDSRTTLNVLCDEKGLHIFMMAYDSQADQVTAGKVRGGGYEMYLAPGNHQAYHTFLSDITTGNFAPQMFLTHYPSANVHPLSRADHTFATQTRQVDGGFATSMFMSWASFYDKLPEENDRWQFEAIRWTRQGGFSFGGSESVHNRTSWGDLVFKGMGQAQLTTIRRGIINTAIQRYAKSKSVTSPVGNWADPDLGDPRFHEQHVAPLLKRLDAAVTSVNSDMTDDQINQLYLEAVPLWMDLEHHVAAMRRDYLQNQLLEL